MPMMNATFSPLNAFKERKKVKIITNDIASIVINLMQSICVAITFYTAKVRRFSDTCKSEPYNLTDFNTTAYNTTIKAAQ